MHSCTLASTVGRLLGLRLCGALLQFLRLAYDHNDAGRKLWSDTGRRLWINWKVEKMQQILQQLDEKQPKAESLRA